MPRVAGGVNLDIEHTLGDNAALTRARNSGILNSVLKIEQYTRIEAGIAVVDQYGASA